MSAPLRVVTVFQPWASLIMVGAKPYEFRSKRPPRTIVNERVVIHAAARRIQTREVCEIIAKLEEGGESAAQTCLKPDLAMPILERALLTGTTNEFGYLDLRGRGDLPWGAGLGTAICGEGRSGYDIAEEFGAEHVNDSDRDEHANYGWPMTDIEVWPEPVPARGSQGIWFWPTPAGVGL